VPLDNSESAFTEEVLRKIFSFESQLSDRLISRENGRLEFKEAFDLGSADKYAKTAAAFANAQGGYIVFGVKDSPRQMVGLKTQNFENFDTGKLTAALNEWMSPEIEWESFVWKIRGYKVGLLYFAESAHKPVVCTKNGKSLSEGAIFYRYRGRSETIKFPELRRVLDEEKARERNLWIRQLKKMADVGVGQVAVLDLKSGEVSGAQGTFLISEELLPKLQFLREGHFVEADGAPALKLIGDLQATEGPILHSTIAIPTALRESHILSAFLKRESVINPLDYLRTVCFESSAFFPVYYFIQQTTETVDDAVDVIRSLEVKGVVRDKVVSRLQQPDEVLTLGKLTGSSDAAHARRALYEKLQKKSVEPADLQTGGATNSQLRFLEALTHTDSSFDQEYIFTLLQQHYLPILTHLRGSAQTAFRKALCHLDIIWYREQADKISSTPSCGNPV